MCTSNTNLHRIREVKNMQQNIIFFPSQEKLKKKKKTQTKFAEVKHSVRNFTIKMYSTIQSSWLPFGYKRPRLFTATWYTKRPNVACLWQLFVGLTSATTCFLSCLLTTINDTGRETAHMADRVKHISSDWSQRDKLSPRPSSRCQQPRWLFPRLP